MRLMISTVFFLLLTASYLRLSGAPPRVHFLSVLCLAIAFWVPAILASTLKELRRRWIPCVLLAIAGMVLWDATARLVIAKAKPLDTLIGEPWVYIIGVLVLVGLVSLSACIGSLFVRAGRDGPRKAG